MADRLVEMSDVRGEEGVLGVGSGGAEVDGARGGQSDCNSAGGMEIAAAESNAAAGQIQEEAKVQGKTCHQCRQKKTYFAATCKTIKKKGLCPLSYCQKCLLNRYGELADEVAQKEGWNCPKCRGECNCSMCRKRSGKMPTGKLAFAAKASGCSSVHDLLNKGPEMVAAAQKLVTPAKGNPKRLLDTDDGADKSQVQGEDANAISSLPASKKLKVKRTVNKTATDEESLQRTESPEIVLPRGTPITNIAGVELQAEDVGPALHFYEFCNQFAEVLGIEKEQLDIFLQDITGCLNLRVVPSLVAELHINLLLIINPDIKEMLSKSKDEYQWIKEMSKYISNSDFILKELLVNSLNQGVVGYINLSTSCKLHVLNFLCDETLSSEKLRNWIVEQKEKTDSRMRAARGKTSAARELEKKLKKRHSDMVKAMLLVGGGETPNSEEINNIISQIKEAEQAKQAAINALEEEVAGDLWSKATKPIIVDQRGAYWKLHGYGNGTTIVCQEFENEKTMGNKPMWFLLNEDEEKIIADSLATK